MPAVIQSYATDGPGDVRELEAILSRLPLDRVSRLAVLGKTEGTATINDFSRDIAIRSTEEALHKIGGPSLLDRTTLIFSTGCEGILSPGVDVIATLEEPTRADGPPRLAMGGARSTQLSPEDMITATHSRSVARATEQAMAEAGLAAKDVVLVLVKTPILTHSLAASTGNPNVIARAGSSARARGAAALGVALALGELTPATVDSMTIGKDVQFYARRAMTFSGIEVTHNEVLVLGNRPGAGGDLMIHAAQFDDIIDARSLKRLFRTAGCGLDEDGELTGTNALKAVFLKAGVAQTGLVRGNRTTVFQSEVDPDKHMRSAASGVVGAMLGTTRIFVSGGAEHQAPPGGGLAACIRVCP